MNHSFYSADRTTHLKIVVIALIGATALAATGIVARSSAGESLAGAEHAGIIKAGKPAMMASRIQIAVR